MRNVVATALHAVLLTALYFAGSVVAVLYLRTPADVTLFWPAAGIGYALVLRYGLRYALVIPAAQLLLHLLVVPVPATFLPFSRGQQLHRHRGGLRLRGKSPTAPAAAHRRRLPAPARRHPAVPGERAGRHHRHARRADGAGDGTAAGAVAVDARRPAGGDRGRPLPAAVLRPQPAGHAACAQRRQPPRTPGLDRGDAAGAGRGFFHHPRRQPVSALDRHPAAGAAAVVRGALSAAVHRGRDHAGHPAAGAGAGPGPGRHRSSGAPARYRADDGHAGGEFGGADPAGGVLQRTRRHHGGAAHPRHHATR